MIHRLLEHLLFMFTLFAAAAPPIAGGTDSGAGTGGSDAGKGAGDATGTGTAISTGDDVGAGHDPGGESDAGAGADARVDATADDFGTFDDFDADEPESSPDIDHEEFGPETYREIKEALKTKPEVFKAVKRAVGENKRFREHIESPETLGKFLADINQFGGWDTIKQDTLATATFLTGFNAGDKEVVSKWLEENGEGLSKNMPTILNKWRESDEAAWAHDAAQTFKATLLQPNPETGLSPIAALRQLGQIEGVKDSDAYKTIMNRINGVIARADEAPPKKQEVVRTDDPKLTEREQRVKQQEATLRKQALGGKAEPLLGKEAKNALQLASGGKKLSERGRADLTADIHREFARLVDKLDQDGKQKRQRLLAAGQDEQWLKMVKSAAARFMPIAAKNVWRKYNGIAGLSTAEKQKRQAEGQSRRETGTGGTNNQGLQTLSPGDGRQIDWDAMRAKFGGRDKADEIFSFGLKNFYGGKRVWMKKGDAAVYTY